MLRTILAPNPSAMTLDGTRTYLVGRRRVAVLDPGPHIASHLDALEAALGGADAVILLTHRHPDHADAAGTLAERLGANVLDAGSLQPDQRIPTDAGDLVAVPTPGHTHDHIAFHHPSDRSVFVGDLMMGGLDTALVAASEGDVGDYLASLERVRELRPRVLYPAHGPAFDRDPDAAIGRYIAHRHEREAQVMTALRGGAGSVDAIVDAVYGPALDPRLRGVAADAVLAYLEHLNRTGRAADLDGAWTPR